MRGIRGILEDRTAGWIACAITAFLSLFLFVMELAGVNTARLITGAFWGSKSEPKNESGIKPEDINDPLGIVGTWTYTTSFDSETDSKKHKYKAVQGVNFLIKFDGRSYAM